MHARKSRASAGAADVTVITTASATLSHQPGDTIETVDRQGQRDLIDAVYEHLRTSVLQISQGIG